jgi:O-antigen ligase
MLGALCLLGVILLWAAPYRSRVLNVCAGMTLVAGLIMAQSKLAWAGVAVCSVPLIVYGAPDGLRGVEDPRSGRVVTLLVTGAGLVALLLLAASFLTLGLGDLGNERVVGGVTTLTGRTEIWNTAYEEWARYPIFGYGSDLFGPEYRYAIGMEHFTSGHNQIVDSTARAGIVGLLGALSYLGVLAWAGLSGMKASAGVSVALLCALLLRSITEVPLEASGYGPENLLPFILLAVVASPWSGSGRTSAEPASLHVHEAEVPPVEDRV